MARDKLAAARFALDSLKALRNRADSETAERLFQIRDRIELVIAGGKCAAAFACLNAITRLAETMILDAANLRDTLWVAAIDATEEWIWVKE